MQFLQEETEICKNSDEFLTAIIALTEGYTPRSNVLLYLTERSQRKRIDQKPEGKPNVRRSLPHPFYV